MDNLMDKDMTLQKIEIGFPCTGKLILEIENEKTGYVKPMFAKGAWFVVDPLFNKVINTALDLYISPGNIIRVFKEQVSLTVWKRLVSKTKFRVRP